MPKLRYVNCGDEDCEECRLEEYRLELVEKCREQYIINDELKTEMRRRRGLPIPDKLAPAYLGIRRAFMKKTARELERYLRHLQRIEGLYVTEKWKKGGKIELTTYNYYEQGNQDDVSEVLKEFWKNFKKTCRDLKRIFSNRVNSAH